MTSVFALALLGAAQAQTPTAGELQRQIEHLQVAGSVLYVAAHPDDENTRLIGWLVGDQGLQTTYLSMTRGGGGQNLIGTEQSELLGVVRTGELLAARSVDGGQQRFTRMRDFGYSKSPEEALSIWGHDDALADVVLAVRTVRPDVIITRFSTEGGGHGHHTASAILAGEAFEAAADPGQFALEGLDPWQADRLLRNTSTWRIPEGTDTSSWLRLDVGSYDPRTGASYGEVAAASRTMHKSQGFGSSPSVGTTLEYFLPIAGTRPDDGGSPLAGLDLTLARFEGTKALVKSLARAADRFDARAPHESLPELAKAHSLLDTIPDPKWRAVKRGEIESVMADCAGLWVTARADRPAASPSQELKVALTVVARATEGVTLHEVTLDGAQIEGGPLERNLPWTADLDLTLPDDAPWTRPHWLTEAPTASQYTIEDPGQRTNPDTPARLQATFDLTVAGVRFTVQRPVEYAWTDRVRGQIRHALEVLPPATASFDARGLLIPTGTQATTRVTVRAETGPVQGTVKLTAPDGVTVTPASVAFDLGEGVSEQVVDLTLTAEPGASAGPVQAVLATDRGTSSLQQHTIDHPHLPRRTILSEAILQATPVALDRGGVQRIAYVMGSGDALPDGLRSVGYDVELVDEDDILAGLEGFDALILGIRAYNTRDRLTAVNAAMMDFVEAGGRVVMQYNTNSRWSQLTGPIGPAPFTIGRGRVTDETAPMTPVEPQHPALVGPNVLDERDFEGWVQERGLYFATEWDDAYTPLFSTHDAGEDPLLGSVLIAEHGEGVFIYSGISFFRQLPAGVPGATRLLANLLAL